MKFSRRMHTLTLGVKQLKIKSKLGVILETDLSFSSHVTKSAYYHLKNIRCFVSSQDLEKLVHVFISSRVDYCYVSFQRRALDSCSSSRTLILTRTRTSEHITPVLRSLHWLPVTFRINLKYFYSFINHSMAYDLNTWQICSLNINLTEHSDQ